MTGSPPLDRLAMVALETIWRSRREITALLVVQIDDATYLRAFAWQIRPAGRWGVLFPPKRRRDLALAPSFEEVEPEIAKALTGRTMVMSRHADYRLLCDRLTSWDGPPRMLLFREAKELVPFATLARIPHAKVTRNAMKLRRTTSVRPGRLKWRWTQS